jgi:uncharacterized protein YydD (DUF2326 family)
MAHDGCIFSEMDSRQKSTILKIILELTANNDFQYFLNIGQNTSVHDKKPNALI